MHTMQLVFRGLWSLLSQHNCIKEFNFNTYVYAAGIVTNNVYLCELIHILIYIHSTGL